MRKATIALLLLTSCRRDPSSAQPAPSASVAVKLFDLPKAMRSDGFVHPMFTVDVNADGTYAVNGLPVPESEIAKRASEERGKYTELRAVILADGTVPFQRVIRVMDLLRQGGISQLAFAVSPAELQP